MALKKTAKYYSNKETKAKAAFNKANAKFKTNVKATNKIGNQWAQAKTAAQKKALSARLDKAMRSLNVTQSARDKAKAKYNTAKTELSNFKKNQGAEKRKASLAMKKALLKQMAIDKPGYWNSGRPYIIPKYPASTKSYVFIDNTSENISTSSDISTNTISPGQYINHYTQAQPTTRQVDGKLGGSILSTIDGLKLQTDRLERWTRNGTEVEYHGQKVTTSAVLTNTTPNFDAPRDNAIPISVTLQDVRWAKTINNPSSKKPNSGKKGPNKTGKKGPKKGGRDKNKGNYSTIKPGDTYWGFHLKFGTPISKLRSWNGFPDRQLPVGKKIRVK